MRRTTRLSLLLMICAGLMTDSPGVLAQKGGKGKQGQATGRQKNGRGGGHKGGGKSAQKDNRESPAAHLPVGFQQLSRDEVKQLDGLTQRALGWIGESSPKRTRPSLVAPFFGGFGTARGSTNDPDEGDGEEQDQSERLNSNVGLLVLAVLDDEQRDVLARLLIDQRNAIQVYAKTRDSLTAKLQEIRGQTQTSRTFDRGVAELAGELGEQEASIGLAQAKAFVELRKSLREDQLEYLQLVRANSDVLRTETPAVQKVRDLLAKLDDDDQEALQSLAIKAVSFATGTADQNALVRDGKSATLLGSVKAGGKSDGSTTAFLGTLTVAQQRQLYLLLQSEQRVAGTYAAKRSQIIAALDSLKDGKPVNEQRMRQAGSALVTIEGRVALQEARTFEQLSTSLSKAQSVFISQNLLAAATDKGTK